MSSRRGILLAHGGAAAIAMLAVAVVAPRTAAAGWLIGFCYAAGFPLGALAWIMIHRLTGGRWGDRLMPLLAPLARCVPLVIILLIPILLAAPILLPDAAATGAVSPDVAALYLSVPSYVARNLVALSGIAAFAWFVPRSGALIAALGLVFYAIAIDVLAVDWNLVIEPPFHSTSFGASVAVSQLLAVLALAAVLDAAPDRRADLGGLLLTMTLGITYLDFMAVLIIWYGDLPATTFWFLRRLDGGWRLMAVAAFVIGSFLPIVMLMFARVRQSRRGLRAAGGCVLVGLALYQAWLIAPAFGALACATAVLAAAAQAAFIAAAALDEWPSSLATRRRPAHGR